MAQNLFVVDHLGPFRVHLDPFWRVPFRTYSGKNWYFTQKHFGQPQLFSVSLVVDFGVIVSSLMSKNYPNVITIWVVKTIKKKAKQRGNWDFLATEAILWLKCKIAINISWLQTYGVFIFHQYQIGVNALWPASLQIAFAIIFFANKPTQLFQGWMNFS